MDKYLSDDTHAPQQPAKKEVIGDKVMYMFFTVFLSITAVSSLLVQQWRGTSHSR